MNDFFGLLRAAYDEIVVLGSVICAFETADLFRDFPFDCKEMADVIVGPQQVRIEIRLKMRVKMMFPLHIRCV